MIDVAFWLTQDLLTVLASGVFQIPEIFLFRLVFRLLTEDRDLYVSLIWTAFVGGLLWDLRWVGVPGFFALSYVGVLLAVLWVWNVLPLSGRTLSIVFFLFSASQLLPAFLHTLILSPNVEGVRWSLFGVQQISVVPFVLGAVFVYAVHSKDKNA